MAITNHEDILRALLDTDLKVEKQVFMKRFGVSFTIRALDIKEIDKCRDQATDISKGGVKKVNNELLGALIVEKACISPDWTDKSLKEKFGATAADVILNRLLSGEIARLTEEVMNLSGFGDDTEEIEEIKN